MFNGNFIQTIHIAMRRKCAEYGAKYVGTFDYYYDLLCDKIHTYIYWQKLRSQLASIRWVIDKIAYRNTAAAVYWPVYPV